MSAFTAISSMIELAVIIFLIYGFYKEDKFIAFEQKVKMIIVVNYRRYKRKKRIEQMRKNREFKQKGCRERQLSRSLIFHFYIKS